jgi:hypothetical protein
MDDECDAIAGETKTAGGKALVSIAKKLFAGGSDRDVKNALAALRLAKEHENNDTARRLKKLEERHTEKGQARVAANRLRDRKRAAAGGNVVDFPSKDAI